MKEKIQGTTTQALALKQETRKTTGMKTEDKLLIRYG